MYKRSVITDEVSQDLDAVVDVARAFRLEGLEIRSVWDTRIDKLTPEQVQRLRTTADQAGLAIAAVAPPFFKCSIESAEEYREHLALLRRTIEIARELGTSLIRTFTFWKTRPAGEVWDRIIELYQEPIKIAQEEGVTLALENEAACFVSTGAELGRFVDAIDRPELRALWDPGNAFWDEQREQAFPNGYEHVRGKIVHVHLKDATVDASTGKPSLTALGDGDVRIAEQLRALEADGYKDFVSLETHWRPSKAADDSYRLPGGRAFSEAGAVASIQCLKNWDAMIARRSSG